MGCCCVHFIDYETGNQRDAVTQPKSHTSRKQCPGQEHGIQLLVPRSLEDTCLPLLPTLRKTVHHIVRNVLFP